MERHPAVAGRFYPDDERELGATVDALLGPDPAPFHAHVVIAPHAAYRFSGDVAGSVYRRVRVPPVVIVLGPNHTGRGARAAVMTHGSFRLPGASVPIDSAIAEELRGVALLTDDHRAHAEEHSLEVQLPFLLRLNPRVRIVPVCLSQMPYPACVRIGTAVADVVTKHGRDVLVVATTDMSHYLPEEEAARLDRLAIERIEALDPKGLYSVVAEHDISMCGVVPATIALVTARSLDAGSAELVAYSHSGQVNGDNRRVVGYAGFLIR